VYLVQARWWILPDKTAVKGDKGSKEVREVREEPVTRHLRMHLTATEALEMGAQEELAGREDKEERAEQGERGACSL
jgi:hypothetical protein